MAYFKCNVNVQQTQSNTLYTETRSWNKTSQISWTAPRTGTIRVHLYLCGYCNGTNSRKITFSLFGKTLSVDNYSGDSSDHATIYTYNTYDVNVTKNTRYTSSYTEQQASISMLGAAWTYID